MSEQNYTHVFDIKPNLNTEINEITEKMPNFKITNVCLFELNRNDVGDAIPSMNRVLVVWEKIPLEEMRSD